MNTWTYKNSVITTNVFEEKTIKHVFWLFTLVHVLCANMEKAGLMTLVHPDTRWPLRLFGFTVAYGLSSLHSK